MTHPPRLEPFDLALAAAKELLYPRYWPPRWPTAEEQRKHAAAMAEARRETQERFERDKAEWQRALDAPDDERVRAALKLHEPNETFGHITCRECGSYDQEGLSSPDWPCPTYRVLAQ